MRKEKRKIITNILLAALTIGVAGYSLAPAVANQIGSVKPASQRQAMSDFVLSTLGDGKWSLADQRGKVVLVNFWASWCPPCRMETPDLVATHRKFADRGFTVVGVTLDEDPGEDVPPFVKRYGIPYPILLPNSEVGASVSSLPTSVLIDAQGRVAKIYVGLVTESALERDVEALLKERS